MRSEWGYTCYFASFSSQSRGVAILFNNNFEFKVHKVYKDAGGNLMFISLTTMDKDLLLVNVYGPNSCMIKWKIMSVRWAFQIL